MSTSSLKSKGGLVLKKSEIQWLLDEPGAVGVAFGVDKAGEAKNVHLKVYKVVDSQRGLVGEERNVSSRRGADSVEGLPGRPDDFQFEHLTQLRKGKFDFAYIEKEAFLKLFSNGEDEVFIAGAVKDFGSTGRIKGKWFTLAITPRRNPELEASREFGDPPSTTFLGSCPPIWRPRSAEAPEDLPSAETSRIWFQQADH